MKVKVFLLALTFICGFSPLQAEVVDRVVAVVNDDPITLYELDLIMANHIDKIKEATKNKKEKFKDYRSLALKTLIEEKLLEQEMVKKKVTVTKADEEKAVKNVLERNKLTLDQLKKEIQSKGQSWDTYLETVRVQLKRIKFMGQVIAPRVKVTDADLDEFFAQHPEKFANFQSVEMAQIILPLEPGASDTELLSAQAKGEEVLKKARSGADFEALGKKYSVNPQTAVKNTYPVNQLAPQLVSILSDLKAGEVSEPVRSNMGLHILKLYDRKTLAGDEYQAIREQIRERVFEVKIQESMQEYLDDLKNHSFIEIKG